MDTIGSRKTEDTAMDGETFLRDAEAIPAEGDVKAWELIDPEAGRYMPRRIRGSFRGRALG
jgi:hypothetical protein